MKSHWFNYQEKRIWLTNYSNFGVDGKALQQEMDEILPVLSQEKPGSVLTLIDVTGTRGTPEIFNLMRNMAVKLNPYVRKRAVIGLTGVQKTFFDLINKASGDKNYIRFEDVEAAKNWLVE